ncbi:Cytochrome c oxidase subunit 6A, mitochondrial [Pyrenophora teres f. teres]|uniref:Cytochrome c oxidase subunit 12, mitochondrial n=1 Tax=Pyrenophora teres f. teres (strain 0-1) TaxID=861557 RepID=E3REI7_PYRTT|nr:hypothetical protein PTT_04468 [Pyrenophora teres f. teres 0-1]KAK1907350.1 Cytochrome c oxidase subunit 6A, mitochondrial [Pyrenophora teres f. teres]
MSDNENCENGDELVTKPFKFVTAGTPLPKYHCDLKRPRNSFDARFPNQNQTKHCWQNYVDYHKCIIAKGEEFSPCRQFMLAYRSLCPSGWTSRWDDQREKGNFPVKLDQ